MVRETTYASVASQTSTEVVPVIGGVDVEVSSIGGGPLRPPPVPVVPTIPVALGPGLVEGRLF